LCGQVLSSASHYPEEVSKQSHTLRAVLQPLTDMDKEKPQGHIDLQDDFAQVTREVINFMGRDEVVFQHLEDLSSVANKRPQRIRSVEAVLEVFKKKGIVKEGKSSIAVTGLHFLTGMQRALERLS
jgi:chromosome segregation ATPase